MLKKVSQSSRKALKSCMVATISLWGILLARGDLELANAPIKLYHPSYWYCLWLLHILSVFNLFCLIPGKQATKFSASSTKIYKTTSNCRKYLLLTLRQTPLQGLWGLGLTIAGGPMPLAIPAHHEVARETSTPLFPKNWAFHLLRRKC